MGRCPTRRGPHRSRSASPQGSQPANEMVSLAIADQYLRDFDITDAKGTSCDYLSSIIVSGHVPQEDLAQLREVSLMSGVEQWDMMIARAQCMESRIVQARPVAEEDPGLIFLCLQAVREHKVYEVLRNLGIAENAKASTDAKRKTSKTVSRYWNTEQGSVKQSMRKLQSSEIDPATRSGDQDQGQPPLSQAIVGAPGSTSRKRRKKEVTAPEPFDEEKGAEQIFGPSGSTSNHDALDEEPVVSEESDKKRRRKKKRKKTKEARKHEEEQEDHQAFENQAEDDDKKLPTEGEEPAETANGKRKRTIKSPYFTPVKSSQAKYAQSPSASAKERSRTPGGMVSSLPVPPLSASSFGLIQEELSQDPFQLLIAVTFLIKTKGTVAIPVFRELMKRFPTPEALVAADANEIIPMIHHLGLSANRCTAIQRYAKTWIKHPPSRWSRYGVKNYPRLGDGNCVKSGEQFGPEDSDSSSDSDDERAEVEEGRRRRARGFAWEIGHMTQGQYAIDSWRIFCRDIMLGKSKDWMGYNARDEGFQPEWMRVLPQDKELKACLRWMWMKEGWWWDPLTGERDILSAEMRRAVEEGRVGYDDTGMLVILDRGTQD